MVVWANTLIVGGGGGVRLAPFAKLPDPHLFTVPCRLQNETFHSHLTLFEKKKDILHQAKCFTRELFGSTRFSASHSDLILPKILASLEHPTSLSVSISTEKISQIPM